MPPRLAIAIGCAGWCVFVPIGTAARQTAAPAGGTWNIAPRNFTRGFPGVTDRDEWFAIDSQGSTSIPDAGIATRGYAATKPVATNTTPAGRRKNRRVEISIAKSPGQ